MNRDQFEYLVKSLSHRPSGKSYENFVVNYLWYRLHDSELRPVTQQYVNRRASSEAVGIANFARASQRDEGRNHAFIDLYFPQLHLGIECDEAQHFIKHQDVEDALQHPEMLQQTVMKQQEADAERSADIARVIPGYSEIRIPVEIDESGKRVEPGTLIQQLDQTVELIRERKEQVISGVFSWAPGWKPWRSDKSDWELAKETGKLRVSDQWLFKNNGEVRALFGKASMKDGKPVSSTGQSNFKLNSEYTVWCPTLSEFVDGTLTATNSKGILNVLFEEGDDVYIGQADPRPGQHAQQGSIYDYSLLPEEYDDSKVQQHWLTTKRITFARVRDGLGRTGYQFIGVFAPPHGFRLEHGVYFKEHRMLSTDVDLEALVAPADES